MKKFLLIFLFVFLLNIQNVLAHCPLCTVGAAAVAGGAAAIGVNGVVIGLFIGAFAMSMGLWFSKIIKKKFMPFQKQAIVLLSLVTTVFPLLPLLTDIQPLYISIAGGYGTLLNRTYLIDMFLIGSFIGALIIAITPVLSKKITDFRNNKMIPYQGILLTFGLLIIIGVILQVIS